MEKEWAGILNMLYYTNVGYTLLFWEQIALVKSSEQCVLQKHNYYSSKVTKHVVHLLGHKWQQTCHDYL